VDAWRHVHSLFDGVDNVTWVWAPNVSYTGSTPLADVYPGDDVVDLVALSGYNFGTPWEVFADVFDVTLGELAQVAPSKPVLIRETACAEDPLDPMAKAAWITDFFAQLAARPVIRGFCCFNVNKSLTGGVDWRIQSSANAQAAFATGLVGFPAAPAPLRRRDTTP
jgi:hypothetical protein